MLPRMGSWDADEYRRVGAHSWLSSDLHQWIRFTLRNCSRICGVVLVNCSKNQLHLRNKNVKSSNLNWLTQFATKSRTDSHDEIMRDFAVFIAMCLPIFTLVSIGGRTNAEASYSVDVDLQEHGWLEEAIAASDESIRLGPQFVEAYEVYNNRGRFLL